MSLSAYAISFGAAELLHFSEKQQYQQGIGQSQQLLDMITLATLLKQKTNRCSSDRSPIADWMASSASLAMIVSSGKYRLSAISSDRL